MRTPAGTPSAMRESFLAIFRGSDGRSLAKALACLLVFNAFIAGLHTGAMAAPMADAVICSIDGAAGPDNVPVPDGHQPPCCVTATGGNPAFVPDVPALAPPSLLREAVFATDARVPDRPHAAAHQPRGPPSLA
jgi:hypothetical protein